MTFKYPNPKWAFVFYIQYLTDVFSLFHKTKAKELKDDPDPHSRIPEDPLCLPDHFKATTWT